MMYGIEIGFEYFEMNEHDGAKRMFTYCELQFGFSGAEWDRIKKEYDYESMGELLEKNGVNYQEFIE